jgi:hypothetical protein
MVTQAVSFTLGFALQSMSVTFGTFSALTFFVALVS